MYGTICVCMYVGPRAETVLAEASQHRDRAEFQLGKLKEATSLQKQDLEYQLQARADEIEHLKVSANNHWYPYAGLYLKFRYLRYLGYIYRYLNMVPDPTLPRDGSDS